MKAFLFSSLLATCVGVTACSTSTSSSGRLSGVGATFPAKIYTRWFTELAKGGGPQVNYQAVGSGSGRKAFIDQTVNFAASDDAMKPEDIKKVTRGLVQIPMVGGTIAFGYNWNCDLKLTQEQAVQVALGKINNWDQLNCPAGEITWVHRSDGSGTTRAFTNSMQAFSKQWTLGIGKSVEWPSGVGAKGNSGVAGVITNSPGTMGYLNQSYVKGKVKAAALQNLAGEFVTPSGKSGAVALTGIKLDSNLAGTNPNPAAKGAYPIATLTWLLAYEIGNDNNLEALKTTFDYMLSDDSQSMADGLGFVPLQGEILSKARAAVSKVGK